MNQLPFPEEIQAIELAAKLSKPVVDELMNLVRTQISARGGSEAIIPYWTGVPFDWNADYYNLSKDRLRENHIEFPDSYDVSFFRFMSLAQDSKLHVHHRTITCILLVTNDSVVLYAHVPEAINQTYLQNEHWKQFTENKVGYFPRSCPHASQTTDPLAWGLCVGIRPEGFPADDEDTYVLPD